jgi:UDP-N-acetylglucosamine--N-acetylmuramyl-(pentapeptide) pyrophosphoryl-undecaprenol N-acetylglucosamine transferase
MPRIALIGGYTAGHVFPMLAVAEAYRARDARSEILFVGGRDSLEAALIAERGYACHEVDGAPLFGVVTRLGRLRSYAAFLRGLVQARRLLAREKVDLALGFGGYVTAAPMLAARSLGIATAIFEANVIPGRANRLVQLWVDRRLLGFRETTDFPGWRVSIETGYPLRREICALAAEPRGVAAPERGARILVTGGSRGSPFLNRAAAPMLAHLARRGVAVSVLHQSGLEAPEPITRAYREAGVDATVERFTADMTSAYRRADFAICAAGAGTLAEIAALGLPALIVPMSGVADDHQAANARVFAERTGVLWVREADWQEAGLADALARTIADRGAWLAAAAGMRAAARPDAAIAVVEACERLLEERRRGAGSVPVTAATGSSRR